MPRLAHHTRRTQVLELTLVQFQFSAFDLRKIRADIATCGPLAAQHALATTLLDLGSRLIQKSYSIELPLQQFHQRSFED